MALSRMRFPDHMDDIFDELTDLTLLQRHTLKERYRFMMDEYRTRCMLYSILFYTFRITVTVGSLAVPALLSIENATGASSVAYWFTWGLSLAVTTANGIMTLFKLDKRFFMLHATAERLRSETWQFVQLSGRYSGHHGHHHKKPTHDNQFVYYCTQLEKINMKRIDDEYVKAGDEGHPQPGQPAGQPGQKLLSDTTVPSPPEQTLQTPESVRERISIVEDEDEEESKDAKGEQVAVQVQPLQTSTDPGLIVLRDPSKL